LSDEELMAIIDRGRETKLIEQQAVEKTASRSDFWKMPRLIHRSQVAESKSASLRAMAVGAFAIGAFAVGILAIGRVAIGNVRIRSLKVDTLTVRRLNVEDGSDIFGTPQIPPASVNSPHSRRWRRRSGWSWSRPACGRRRDRARRHGLSRGSNGGLIATPSPWQVIHRDLIIVLARHQLPAVYFPRYIQIGVFGSSTRAGAREANLGNSW
jgi:hypothetical protein